MAGGGQPNQTFLFADLAGYTALTEAHGDEFAAEAAANFFAAVRRLLPTYDAQEVKCIGDAVMLRVPEPGMAVELAVRLIREVGGRHGVLAVRVGHTAALLSTATAIGTAPRSTWPLVLPRWPSAGRC
jgi:class 3 adenylate cyclase